MGSKISIKVCSRQIYQSVSGPYKAEKKNVIQPGPIKFLQNYIRLD